MSGHPYRHIHPWKSLAEFVESLAANVVYRDRHLVAVSKPWGVGIHRPTPTITKANARLILGSRCPSAKYCVDYAMEQLAQRLGVNSLQPAKSLDRNNSGIMLLATGGRSAAYVRKSLARARPLCVPHIKSLCVVNGWPVFDGPILRERVGIKYLELDELGDHKEPIIIDANRLKNSMRKKRPQKDGMAVRCVLAETRVLDCNRSLGVSLVELSSTDIAKQFISCYLANKASFVLGDLRFSRRVKHILGTAMSMKASAVNMDDDSEPLSEQLCRALKVKGNAYVPLMIHRSSLVLPKYFRGGRDLVIEDRNIPEHFRWTIDRLGLKYSLTEESEENESQLNERLEA